MPDPNRLNDLRRQRELVAEQLAWIDREIAAAGGLPTTTPATAVPPPPALRLVTPAAAVPIPPSAPVRVPIVPLTPPAALNVEIPAHVAAQADAMLDEYRVAPDAMKSDVKKGCFLYFFAAFALFALGVVALYFIFRAGK